MNTLRESYIVHGLILASVFYLLLFLVKIA